MDRSDMSRTAASRNNGFAYQGGGLLRSKAGLDAWRQSSDSGRGWELLNGTWAFEEGTGDRWGRGGRC